VKLLLDQDVYAVTCRHLRAAGHDVATAADRGQSRAADFELLAVATDEGRIFVTRDRDFGELVFVRRLGAGVLYLRMLPANFALVHEELDRVLGRYAEPELRTAFVVVEPGRHRIRRL